MNIILYSKTDCDWSNEVRELFQEKGIKFEERDVLKNKSFASELMKKSGMIKSPTVEIDGKIYADTGRSTMEKVLGTLGL